MAYSTEPSSSISFTSSSYVSNGSTLRNLHVTGGFGSSSSADMISLSKLSNNLQQLLPDAGGDYSDAEIEVEGIAVGIHRCILAARSRIFHDLFKRDKGRDKGSAEKEGKPKYYMKDILPYGKVGYEAFVMFLSYLYTGKLKASPPEVSSCVDNLCAHDACRPAVTFAVELIYAATIFQISDLISIFERRLLNFVGKALVEDIVPITVVAFHCRLSELLSECVDRVAGSDLESIFIEKEAPNEVAANIKSSRAKFLRDKEKRHEPLDAFYEKQIRRIHKALDSDDVELVKLLLTESEVTLDQAYALHYAAAYCDPKVISELLNLGLADVNLRNRQGYTVLHIAAMRKEPSIIVKLLTKGANVSETTLDGNSAVRICRRLTRPKDYHAKVEHGQESNKDRICIDVLEREMDRDPLVADGMLSSAMMTDDLHARLFYLKNRVAFARLFFPLEAKLVMDIANAETTEFSSLEPKGASGSLRQVDLNETPSTHNKRLHLEMEALSNTVVLGRRYFPNCSQVLDKFMEYDLPDLCYLDKGSADEKRTKKKRFMELKDEVQKAFNKDKAELHRSGLFSSAFSSSFKDNANYEHMKK